MSHNYYLFNSRLKFNYQIKLLNLVSFLEIHACIFIYFLILAPLMLNQVVKINAIKRIHHNLLDSFTIHFLSIGLIRNKLEIYYFSVQHLL
jgi:hypothetical protein